jgi:hypothetical protein
MLYGQNVIYLIHQQKKYSTKCKTTVYTVIENITITFCIYNPMKGKFHEKDVSYCDVRGLHADAKQRIFICFLNNV